MAEYFLSKIRVASEDFVEAGGRAVLERHDELRRLLEERAGPEVAALFAEPLISRGNDASAPTVSWYGDREEEARPLASLSVVERERAEIYLAEHLRPLRALAQSSDGGDLALGALSVYGADDVLVQAGRPVIVNWGLMSGGNGANAASRPAHYAATLGKYMALSGPQGMAAAAAVSSSSAGAPPRMVPGAAGAPPVGGGAGAIPAQDEGRRTPAIWVLSPIAWVPLLILLVIASAVLVWLLWPGTRLFHADGPPPVVTEQATLKTAQALNQALRDRALVLEGAIDGAVCRADGVLLLPDGRTPEGLLPPAIGVEPAPYASASPQALLPSAPVRVQIEGDTSLLAWIEARTVLILASGTGGATTGSGFAVGPGLVVTNFHVIDGAGQVWVAGAGLDRPRRAKVVKTHGPLTEAGGDFALLQIEGTDLPAFSVHVPDGSLKLTNVIAAGFPGDVLALDENFEALTAGDTSAMPDLTVTDGTINTEQNMGPDTHVLMHSAPLSGGNSGGPLVDMCGRLVGVNTFTRQGPMQNRGFALSSGDLLAFLKGTDAVPVLVSDPCAPIVVRPDLAIIPAVIPVIVPAVIPEAKPAQPAKD